MYLTLSVVLSSIAILLIYNFQKQKLKFKNGLYDIGSCIEKEQIRYHLVIEWRHGRYLDTRKLPIKPILLLPTEIKKQLFKTFDDYETARHALETLKININHTSVIKDRSKKRNTFAV